ncbi:MAG: thiamine pyrophosphate-binding protein [Rhodospirillaceae bacterium]|nr:thiamine pyrophosphate-binding protein [Rhodospirillaceae bacterium]
MPDNTSDLGRNTPVTAAQRLVETLIANGVTHVFCVPGESYLAVLDAFADVKKDIQVIACRHEAAAANMATAYGKLTGRPGICFVTRGPGATQGAVGVHTAQQDSVPMIMFVGQVGTADKGREAFQEVYYPAMFGGLAKHAEEIDDPSRVVEITTRAFANAQQGRAGAVVVALPEDMLVSDPGARVPTPVQVAETGMESAALATLKARLEQADKPLLILGGTGWSKESLDQLAAWAKGIDLPVILSFRRKDLLDNHHPCYVGDLGLGPNPKLLARVRAADLLVTIGARLGENPSQGYGLFTAAETAEKLIHIHPDPRELNRVWPASVAAVSGTANAAKALAGLKIAKSWSAWRAEARAEFEAFVAPVNVTGAVNLSEIFTWLSKTLPPDAIVANGAGNYAAWLHRYYLHRAFRTQLAPTSGAMGFGFPAAIAAKLTFPERTVVGVAGDGCFLMAASDLATAVQYGANFPTIVVDNGSYGTIRMHQEREYPGRVSSTDLRNPDFAAYARSFGAWGATVTKTEEFAPAFTEALRQNTPSLLHVKTSVEDILPGKRLSQMAAK